MENIGRCKTAALTVATLAITLLIGTGISEAMQSTSAINRAGAKRAPAIRAQAFGAKSSHVAIHRAGSNRLHAGNARSFAKKRGHMSQGLALVGASALAGHSFKTLPIHVPARTLQPPSQRIPDPSDIPRWDDLSRVPGRDMINSKYLGGPDRESPVARPEPVAVPTDLTDPQGNQSNQNQGTSVPDMDFSVDMDFGTEPQDDGQGGTQEGTAGTSSCGAGGSIKTNTSGSGGSGDTGASTTTEKNPVKETTSKPGDKGSKGTEGDDPDEFRSPIALEAAKRLRMVDMASRNDLPDSRAGNSGISRLSPTGTNTPKGLPGLQHRNLVPPRKNRPDVTGSPVSSLVMANPMSFAASPTPDGETNPPPGPEFNPVASSTSVAAGSTTANRTGYASSPAIGDDGGKVGPIPGPVF